MRYMLLEKVLPSWFVFTPWRDVGGYKVRDYRKLYMKIWKLGRKWIDW